MKLARTKNAFRNTIWGGVYRIITLLGPFVVRTLIIMKLGLEYSGLNSLFTSILTVLNLANLGFSSALVYTMYGAVESENYTELCSMLAFFRKVYKLVGVVILGLGLALIPILPKLINGTYPQGINLYYIYLIFLAGTVLDYFMFAYNNAIFSAFQRNDVTLKISTLRYLAQYILQAIVLVVFSDYYIYLIIQPIMIIPNNIFLFITARRMYPKISCQGVINESIKKDIYKRVWTLFGHKLGSTVLVSIDSIIISSFLNLRILSIYGNYSYILTGVNGIVEILTNASLAGIGNKMITDTPDENYRLFKVMTYGWLFIIGLAACCMMCLYQPFIGGIWLGRDYLLDDRLMILIVMYFYAWMYRIMQLTYRDAAGLWVKDWLKPYVGMVLNLAGSIVMVKYTNSIAGVLLPTILVFVFVYTPWEAWTLFRFSFHRKMRYYFADLLKYTVLVAFECVVIYSVCISVFPNYDIWSFLLRLFIVFAIFPSVWILFTFKTDEFKEVYLRFGSYIKRKKGIRLYE